MHKIQSHTPAWLSRPSPAFQLFQSPPQSTKAPAALSNGRGKKPEHNGPNRTIASRGTEIFVVAGNEIRWSDLILLRDNAEDSKTDEEGAGQADYRLLRTTVAGQIRQLIVSPSGDYLAILTSHTVHVAVIPDSSHLTSKDTSPLRIRTFQVGPTAHVLEQAPVVSALWHPLGHLGACLVTVTSDACVRVWELNRDDRHSFDEPALALDVKKLANATSTEEDLRASKYGTSKAFSPDSVEMEVAAACFGGQGTPEEHGWSPMTLWLAMTEGDVYALCPLLPSKWEPTSTTIPSLSTAVVSRGAMIDHDPDASEHDRRLSEQQHKWLTDLDQQEPMEFSHPDTFTTFEVYSRPAHPPAIPKLQGPFQLSPEPDFADITDIYVVAPRIDDDALMEDEDDQLAGREDLSVGVICLATSSGKVHVCLDLNGVEAQWLPQKRSISRRRFELEKSTASELVLLETVDLTAESSAGSTPVFTPDPTSRYAFFVSLGAGLLNVSLEPWIAELENELVNLVDSGTDFRVNIFLESQRTAVQRILDRSVTRLESPADSNPPACIALLDSDLGFFVLSSSSNQPESVTLEIPKAPSVYATYAPSDAPLALPAPQTRQAYQPPEDFFSPSSLPAFLDSVTQSANTRLKKTDLKSQVRFSPATLQLLTDAHRVLSTETRRLGSAAADLFRRCERMRAELSEQIRKVDDIAKKIEGITGDDDEGAALNNGDTLVGREKIERRMDDARINSVKLQDRVDALRRKMAGLGGKELSLREEAWAQEVAALQQNLGVAGSGVDGEDTQDESALTSRLVAVTKLQRDLVARAKDATAKQQDGSGAQQQEEEEEDLSASTTRIPPDFRKQKIEQVMQLLERESALVDAVTERLERLRGF